MYKLRTSNAVSAQMTLNFKHEEWRKIEGWPYEVSSLGRVRRVENKQIKSTPRSKHFGYLIVLLSDGPRRKTFTVHKLVARAFLGVPPPGYGVNHIDADTSNAKLSNLEYVTQSENILHAVKMGRWPVGSRRWNSKLTEEAVREILESPHDFSTVKALAKKFGVTPPTIIKVINRENWKDL